MNSLRKPKNNQKRRNSQEVPEDVLSHIKYREGYGPRVYKDSLGYLTGGWGHLITPKDNMKLHDLIPPDVAENWLKQDSLKSYRAALEQAKELGKEDDTDLVMILTSVNFQLGTYWRKKFPVSWSLIKEKNYDQAIKNLRASLWYRQTPIRVEDFIKELNRLKGNET